MSNPFSFLKIALAILAATALEGCPSPPPREQAPQNDAATIKFRLDDIRPEGLRGPPDGLVAVSYEFCVPANDRVYQEVRRIDPSVQMQPGSRGRIGCAKDQTLCIGTTDQARWREVLKELSALPYVAEIRECFFE